MATIEELAKQLDNISIDKQNDFKLIESNTFLLFKIIFGIASEYCYFFFNLETDFNYQKISIYLPPNDSFSKVDFLYNYCNRLLSINTCPLVGDDDSLKTLCNYFNSCSPDLYSGYSGKQVCAYFDDIEVNDIEKIDIISKIKGIIDNNTSFEYIVFPFTIYLNQSEKHILLLIYIKKEAIVVSFSLTDFSIYDELKKEELVLFITEIVAFTTNLNYNYVGDIRNYENIKRYLKNMEKSIYISSDSLQYATCVYIIVNCIVKKQTLEETIEKNLNYPSYDEFTRVLILFVQVLNKFMKSNCYKIENNRDDDDTSIYFSSNEREVNISRFNLDTFPQQITEAGFLEKLVISNNNISFLPDEIGNLTNLKLFDISNNNITNIPSTISSLDKLQQFIAFKNKLKNLSFFKTLISVLYIDVSDNPILGNINSFNISSGSCLKVLKMKNCSLRKMPDLDNCNKLNKLDLSNNDINIIEYLNNLPLLIELNLSHNNINSIPSSIVNLLSLKHLNIGYNNLTTIPYDLKNIKQLLTLNLESNQLVSTNVQFMNKFPQLNITPEDISNNVFKVLFNLRSLQVINLANNRIHFIPIIRVIWNRMNNLTKLDLRNIELFGIRNRDREIGKEIYHKSFDKIIKKNIIIPKPDAIY